MSLPTLPTIASQIAQMPATQAGSAVEARAEKVCIVLVEVDERRRHMDVYNRGQWSKDESVSDDWGWNEKGDFEPEGYEKYPVKIAGDELWNIEVHRAKSYSTKYQFVANIGANGVIHSCLVIDFPSLLMLTKELLPLIREDREERLFEMQEEEHVWKSRNLEPHQYRKQCGH